MKMTKVLFGAAILGLVFGFASCKQDDDPNDMISGSNNNYPLEYTNDGSDVSRGYNTSTLKHAGALVEIKFTEVSGNGGIMGFIFDYEQTNKKSTFDVIGVRHDGAYYISKFEDIVDLQAQNFGAKTTAADGEPKETEIVAWSNTSPKKLANWDSSTKTAYLWIVQSEDGSQYDVYNLTSDMANAVEVKDANKGKLVYKDTTKGDVVLPTPLGTIATGYTAQTQKKYGVYANVYNKSTVKGTWKLLGSYLEANVIEE